MSNNSYQYNYFEGTLFRWCIANDDYFLEKMIEQSENKERVVLLISVPKAAVSKAVEVIEKNLQKTFIEE